MQLLGPLCLCLAALAADGSRTRYTPRMFRPGGKYYTGPKNAGGISDSTRAEVSGILKGILENLTKHKAALPAVTADIVQKFRLDEDSSAHLADGLRNLVADEKSFDDVDPAVRTQAKTVLTAVLQHVEYTPRMFRPGGKYYVAPKGSHGGISDATRAEVGGILRGILENLTKHKAALPQMATDIVQKYDLGKEHTELTTGLRGLYSEPATPAEARAVVALVLQHVDA